MKWKTVCWLIPPFLLLAGCMTTTTYTHPTKDAGTFERDRAECERIARKKLAVQGIT